MAVTVAAAEVMALVATGVVAAQGTATATGQELLLAVVRTIGGTALVYFLDIKTKAQMVAEVSPVSVPVTAYLLKTPIPQLGGTTTRTTLQALFEMRLQVTGRVWKAAQVYQALRLDMAFLSKKCRKTVLPIGLSLGAP